MRTCAPATLALLRQRGRITELLAYRYHWNEWVLRRRAVKLADLSSKLARSAQTLGTAFRRDAECQLWQPKVSSTQTAAHKGQSMSRTVRYVRGLRGDPVSMQMSVVSLELDLGQTHQW